MTTINYFELHRTRTDIFFYGYIKILIFPIFIFNLCVVIAALLGNEVDLHFLIKSIQDIGSFQVTDLHYTSIALWLLWAIKHTVEHRSYLKKPRISPSQESEITLQLIRNDALTNELIQTLKSRDIPTNLLNGRIGTT